MNETHERLDEWFDRMGIEPETLSADEKADLAFTYIRSLTERVETLERRTEMLVQMAPAHVRDAIRRREPDDD